jgi:hypothetical protein
MARGEKKGNRESKKPKKNKEVAVVAAGQKPGGWQPSATTGKKK